MTSTVSIILFCRTYTHKMLQCLTLPDCIPQEMECSCIHAYHSREAELSAQICNFDLRETVMECTLCNTIALMCFHLISICSEHNSVKHSKSATMFHENHNKAFFATEAGYSSAKYNPLMFMATKTAMTAWCYCTRHARKEVSICSDDTRQSPSKKHQK